MALCVLLIIFSLQRFVLGTSSSNGVFLVEPSNATLQVGGNATFKCRTQNCEKVSWIHYEAKASGPSTSVTIYRGTSSRQGVVVMLKGCTSTLILVNVRPRQNGALISCSPFFTLMIRSKSARLTVIQPPTPICTFSPTIPKVNDTVSLVCGVPNNAEVPTLLSWYSARSDVQSLLAESRVIEPGSTSFVKCPLHANDNYERFICIAGWGVSHGPNCSVTPLRVRVGYVTVGIVKKYRGKNGMVELDLECRSEAVPDMSNYSWTVREGIVNSPSTVSDEFQGVSWNATSRFLKIDDCKSFSSLIVTCSASNAVGQNATSVPLNISNCDNANPPEFFYSFYLYIWVILVVFGIIVISALCLFCNATRRTRASSGALPVDDHDSTNAIREGGRSTRVLAPASRNRSVTISEYMTVGEPRRNPKPSAVPPPRGSSREKKVTGPKTVKPSYDTLARQRRIDALYAKPNKSTRSTENIEMSQYATIIPKVTDSNRGASN